MNSTDASDEHRYQLVFRPESDVLHVRVSGDIDAQPVRIAYWTEIIATAERQGYRRLLVIDRKKRQPASPTELAELAAMFRDRLARFERVAVVEPTPAFLPAIEHGEIVARAMDLNVRIFADPQAAERWLHFGSPDD